jgi:hypothetical protein
MQQSNAIKLFLDWKVVVVVMIALIILAILFRESLKEFMRRAKFTIRLRLFGILDVDVTALQQVQKQIVDAGIAQQPMSSDTGAALTGADLSARDAVLENWGSLRQIVNDAALSRKIELVPGIELPDVLDRLVNVNLISKQLASGLLQKF